MADQNLGQKAGDFVADAAVDTAADTAINPLLQGLEAKISLPGGPLVDQMINTEVDQVVNNEINTEVNKGAGGIIGDIEGLLGGHHK